MVKSESRISALQMRCALMDDLVCFFILDGLVKRFESSFALDVDLPFYRKPWRRVNTFLAIFLISPGMQMPT